MTMVYVRFVTVTAATMKISVFCDLISQTSTDISQKLLPWYSSPSHVVLDME